MALHNEAEIFKDIVSNTTRCEPEDLSDEYYLNVVFDGIYRN